MTNEPDENPTGDPPTADRTVDAGSLTGLDLLRNKDPELAASLHHVLDAVASEAARSRRFARALKDALAGGGQATPPAQPAESRSTGTSSQRPRGSNRRAPGAIDPFAAYAEGGEPALREALQRLDLDQLRDIVAEHGMDNDRLAMKWKDAQRVIDRIVERVVARSAKGSAFRGSR